MAYTYEDIERVVKPMKTVNIKGKEYVQVTERVKAFRMLCPGGSITTDIVSLDESMVVMKATVANEDGQVLSTGLAFEMRDSSYINKTSFIENCETSAVGRALGWLALGVDASMASAEELVNALQQQKRIKDGENAALAAEVAAPESRADKVRALCRKLGITEAQFGNYKNAAVENGMIPGKRVNELSDLEFDLLMAFVEGNAA